MAGKVYYLKQDYFNELVNDSEFERNINRPYFIVRNIMFKGNKISVAVPLRSNINKKFQTNPDEYIATIPTPHTLTGKGNIAGWHFTKAIPINFKHVISAVPNDPDINAALSVAELYRYDEFINKTKSIIKRIEDNEDVFGVIDFDAAIERLKELDK